MIQSASVCFSCTCTTSTFFARIAFFCHIVSIETFIFPQNPCSETIISKLSLVSLKFLPSCFWKRGGKLNCKVLNTREFFSRSREGSLGPYAHFLSVGVSSTISLKTRRLKNIGLMLIQGFEQDVFFCSSSPTPMLVPNYIHCFRFPTFPNLD